MNELYIPRNVQLGSLTRYQVNAYQETSIVNHTTVPVVVIDHLNQQQIVPPIETSGTREDVISIFIRKGVSPTVQSNGYQIPLDGCAIKIERYKLRNDPIYISELNVLLCTEDQAATARHPFSQVDYHESLELAIDDLSKVIDEAPAFRLIANDPNHSLSKLWTLLDDNVVSIPVTHNPAENATLTIITIREGRVYTENIAIDNLITTTDNTIAFVNKVIPWVTTSQINATELAKTFKWVTPEQFIEYKNKLINEHKANVDQLKAAHSAKILDLTTKISTLDSTIKSLEQERDEYKAKYNNFKADGQINLDRAKQHYAYAELAHDDRINRNNALAAAYKMRAAKEESDFKWLTLCAGVALPILGAMAMKMFDNSAKH